MVSVYGDIQTKDDYTHPLGPETNFNEEARDLIVSGAVDVSPLISRVVSLERTARCLRTANVRSQPRPEGIGATERLEESLWPSRSERHSITYSIASRPPRTACTGMRVSNVASLPPRCAASPNR